MNMNRLYMKSIIWSLLGFLLLVSSCKDEDMGVAYDDGRYREVVLPLSYKVSTSVETRALSTNFEKSCIYQFKSSGEFVTKVDLKSTDDKVALYVPYTEGVTLQCVFIGNASIADVEADGVEVTDLESLLAKHLVINTNYNPGSDDKVLMSGVATVKNTTQSLAFTLHPNVAKVTVTIAGYSEKFNKLFSMQLRNVHNKIHYAHHAFTPEQKEGIHAAFAGDEDYGKDMTRYASESLPAKREEYNDGKVKFTWYVPHNFIGNKRPKVEDNQHTFVVLSYERREDWKTIRIPIYLAQRRDMDGDGKIYEDEVDTYNVEGGVVYNLTITLDDFVEIKEEHKTVELEKYVEFPENTNCHILNPNITGVGTVYSIPVSRAWQYWKDLRGQTLSDDYVVDVIWQDINKRVLTFCDSEGTTTNGQPQATFISSENNKGRDSRFYIKLLNDTPGNVLIGIKANAKSTEYLWSWHIWITDYNPNDVPVPSTEYPNHVFTVPGGEVHRYKDPFDINGNNIKQVFWSDPVNKDVVIMDRNLGAYSAEPTDNSADNIFRNAGMYYQYGRKDPFPASHMDENMTIPTPLYDITGARRLNNDGQRTHFTWADGRTDCVNHALNTTTGNDDATINYSINHPDVFILATSTGDWVPNSTYYVSNWNHNDLNKRDMNVKSLFDPCPLGWRVHRMGAMMIFSNDFRKQETLNKTYVKDNFTINGIKVTDRYYFHETHNDNDDDPATYLKENLNIVREEFLGSDENKIFNGYTFYIADYGKGPTAYYPRTNHRHVLEGFLVQTEDVCNWSIDGGLGDTDPAHVDHIHYGYHLDFYSTAKGGYMDMPDSAGKAYGLAVRCIKENAQESQ